MIMVTTMGCHFLPTHFLFNDRRLLSEVYGVDVRKVDVVAHHFSKNRESQAVSTQKGFCARIAQDKLYLGQELLDHYSFLLKIWDF
jgi:hypothetical protein